jgi:protein-S-isoprenylcysteine O-methyltransferase Ste14
MEDHAGVKIHPPILAALHLGVALLLGWFLPISLPVWGAYVGWGATLFALIVALGGLRALLRAQTSPSPHAPTTSVVTTAVYRFSRNPIYLGYLLLVVGLPLIFGNGWGLIAAPVQVLLFNRLIIAHEEAYLARKFQNEYLNYKLQVRRWL